MRSGLYCRSRDIACYVCTQYNNMYPCTDARPCVCTQEQSLLHANQEKYIKQGLCLSTQEHNLLHTNHVCTTVKQSVSRETRFIASLRFNRVCEFFSVSILEYHICFCDVVDIGFSQRDFSTAPWQVNSIDGHSQTGDF